LKTQLQMTEICPIHNCTGCQTCRLVCPQSAITMLPDKEQGFLYPVIDKNLCTDCGKCIKHCPANHPIKPFEYQQKVYAGWIKKRKNRKFSTSGGLFVALAEYVLKEKGVVFGVEWDKSNYGAKHSYCEKIEEIYKYQGSKYIQSNIGNSYKDVKSFLDEGRLVLFSGTPCQVAGLKYYLNKDYDYLFTIDLVCHGVPSSKVLWKEIEEVERRHGVKLVNLRFRHKTPDQLYASMRYEFNDGTVLMQSIFRSFFFRGFVNNYFLREACYNCKYSNTNRVGDITLGDFWGYFPNKLKFYKYREGVSLILINNKKGNALFNLVKHILKFEESDLSSAIRGNRNLQLPQIKPNNYYEFWHDFIKGYSMKELSDRYFPLIEIPSISILRKIKFWLKLIFPKSLLNIAKQVQRFFKNQKNESSLDN